MEKFLDSHCDRKNSFLIKDVKDLYLNSYYSFHQYRVAKISDAMKNITTKIVQC